MAIVGIMLATTFAAVSTVGQVAQPITKIGFNNQDILTVRVFKDENGNMIHEPNEPWLGLGARTVLYSDEDPFYRTPQIKDCDEDGYTYYHVAFPEYYYRLGGHHTIFWRWHTKGYRLFTPSEVGYYCEIGFSFHPLFHSIPFLRSQSNPKSSPTNN